MITGLFVSPDGESLCIEYDNGRIYELPSDDFQLFSVDAVPNGWTRWTP